MTGDAASTRDDVAKGVAGGERVGNPPAPNAKPPREIELKLEIDRADLHALRKHPLLRAGLSSKPKALHSTYFDTPDQRLRQTGLTLRLRRVGGKLLQTVKSANGAEAGLFDRSEWEEPITGDAPDFAAASRTALAPLLDEDGLRDKLSPVFTVASQRSAIDLAGEGWSAEVVLDDGEVEGAGRKETVCEVELELRSGEPEDLFRVARELAERAPLRLGIRTKADRGYALLSLEKPRAVKSIEPGLDARMTTGAAFQAIARACLRQVISNERILLERREPEAIHQMRVALRRLRAAMSLFKDAIRDKSRDGVASDLKWIAGKLSEARDLDVFIDKEVAPIRAAKPKSKDAARLSEHFDKVRNEAYDAALGAIGSERYRLLLIDTAGWIEAGPWLRKKKRPERDLPVVDFAARALEKRAKHIRKEGRRISTMEVEKRHWLRIAVKKLRYAAEFFAPVFAGSEKARKRGGKYVKALEAMQECLGDLNDSATSAFLSERLDRTDPVQKRAARLLVHDVAGRAAKALADAREAYGAFAKAKPYWN